MKNNKCENCNGTGEIEKNIFVGDEGMQIEIDAMLVCEECNGYGYLITDEKILKNEQIK